MKPKENVIIVEEKRKIILYSLAHLNYYSELCCVTQLVELGMRRKRMTGSRVSVRKENEIRVSARPQKENKEPTCRTRKDVEFIYP